MGSSAKSIEFQQFQLPWPPTANKYWRHQAGKHHINKSGVIYRNTIAIELIQAGYRPIGEARVGIIIVARPPDRQKRDLDNLFKAILDSLQHARIYNDDSQIDYLQISRGQPLQPRGQLDLKLWEIDAGM